MVSNPPSSAQMMDMLVSRHGRFKLGRKLGESWEKVGVKVGWKLGRKLGESWGGRRLVVYLTVLHAEQFGLEHSSSYEFSFFCIKSSLNAVKSASDFSKRLF